MARNRQKAKERQARRKAGERRAAGDGAEGHDGAPRGVDGGDVKAAQPPPSKPEPTPDEPPRPEPEPAPGSPEPGDGRREDPILDPYLEASAPPENVGRSDEVLDHQQDLDALDDEEEEHFDPAEDFPEEDLAAAPKGRRGEGEKHKDRPRFVQFLFAAWAELQRVQWPDRQALTTLTGVVLGFVLIAGGYLGLLDAIFSRILQAIL